MKRIPEFEALRGFLAVWVLVGHALLLSGYESSDLGGLRVLAFPVFAVDVFIILSGFVIFSLLDHKDEGYGPFIIRRFFRLFPLFIVVIALSASLAGFTQHQLETFPWQTQQIVLSARFAKDTIDYLPWQVAVHLTMLHGLVPPWLLPSSTYALIPPAWSVSVEWQFYLVAPLLFGLLRKSVAAISGLLVGTVIVGIVCHSASSAFDRARACDHSGGLFSDWYLLLLSVQERPPTFVTYHMAWGDCYGSRDCSAPRERSHPTYRLVGFPSSCSAS